MNDPASYDSEPARPAAAGTGAAGGAAAAAVRALRPYQWAKNVLLFVPMLVGHRLGDFEKLAAGATAFLAFSLCASAGYVLNDLLDLASDRRHPVKRRRPFASGQLPAAAGPWMVAALLAAGLLLAWAVSTRFLGAAALYVLLSAAYSLYFKRKLLVDVVLLAGLYAYRLVAGGVATGVAPSPWLLAFSIFLFFSLALAKRYAELSNLRAGQAPPAAPPGRGYVIQDLGVILAAGPASGYLAVLVLALYINDAEAVGLLYRRPYLLWLICPVLLYWVTRVWFIAGRGALQEDPLVFALKDRVSYLAGALAVLIVVLAAGWPGGWF